LLKVESYKKGIVLSTFFNIFNKGLVFLNSLLIAYYFGTSEKMDIYFYAYNTVLIVATFITSINTSVIIPESIRIRIQDGESSAMIFINLFIFGYISVAILISLVFFVNPVWVFTSLSKYDQGALARHSDILLLSIPLIILMSVTSLLTDILASYRYFTIPVIAAIINSVFSLVFVLFYHNILDSKSIVFGLLTSYTLNIVLLIGIMRKKIGWQPKLKFFPVSKKIWHNIIFVQTGNFATSLGLYAPLYFLSGFEVGVIASLNYAQQIVTQPTSFITNQISAVSRIKINELYALKDFTRVNDIFISTVKFLVFILLPLSGLFFLFPHEIISTLFKRGSFDIKSVEVSASLLKYLALSLPFTAIISIASNLYMSAQQIKIPILYQIFSNVIQVALIGLSVSWAGYIGYPIALLTMSILNVLVIYLFFTRLFPFIRYESILRYLIIMIGVHTILILCLKLILRYTLSVNEIILIIVGGSVYVAVLIFLSFRLKLNTDFNNFISNTWGRLSSAKKP